MTRLWRLLLALYPASFREQYGDAMLVLLEERTHEVRARRGRLAVLRFTMRNVLDLLWGAIAEHRSATSAWRRFATPRSELTSALVDVASDLRLAVRRFAKSPGFTFVALLLFALGIGANSTIFAVIDAVVLRPLPYDEPDRLVRVWESNPAQGWDFFSFSHPNYLDYRDQNRTFADLAAFADASYNLMGDGDAIQVSAGRVTHNLFPMLGVEPILGRGFSPEEDAPGESGHVVLLTHHLWLHQFGGDPGVLGRTLILSGDPFIVIGVMPAGTQWLDFWDLMTPLNPEPDRHRDDHRLAVVGRLAPGVTAEQAEADLDAIAAALAERYPESNTGFDTRLVGLHLSLVGPETRSALYMLMGAAVFVLLIAATNLANLLLARSSARRRELAVSVALGSSRGRLLRQLITESILLALLGGAAGLALSQGCVGVFRSIDPGRVPRFEELGLSATIVLFTLALSAVTGIFAGLLPSWQATRGNLSADLLGSLRGTPDALGATRARGVLLASEIAVSMVLLVGAGLLMRSFWQVHRIDPGLSTERVLAASLTVPGDRFADDPEDVGSEADQEKHARFYQQLLSEITALPDVTNAALISGLPFGGGATSWSMRIEGRAHERGAAPQAYWRIASPSYFVTLEIPLVSGRPFTDRDDWRSPGVVIISQRMAERFWPGEEAVGKRFYPWEREEDPVEVVGVVGDVRERDLEQDSANIVYLPHYQFLYWSPMYLVVRSNGEPSAALASVRDTTSRLAPDLPLANAEPLRDIMERTLAPRRFNTMLLLCFAGLAIALAAVGIYGVMSFSVARRTPEIGVRMAMGASPLQVCAMVIRDSMSFVALGAVLGLAATLALTRLLESLLFGVSPADPLSIAAALVFLALVALLASALPAWRAARVNAVEALRAE